MMIGRGRCRDWVGTMRSMRKRNKSLGWIATLDTRLFVRDGIVLLDICWRDIHIYVDIAIDKELSSCE